LYKLYKGALNLGVGKSRKIEMGGAGEIYVSMTFPE